MTRYSHVMLGAGGGVIVHADGKTVSVEVVSDALRFGRPDAVRFEVYRRDGMKSGLNSIPGGEPNIGAYAGMASPAVIEEMLLVREALRIFTYLTLAEIGMLTILAHHVPHERFKPFRAVKAEYAQRFLEALPDVDRLPERTVASENGFLWVEAEGDRSMCRTMALNIILSLKFVEVGRRAAQRAESARRHASLTRPQPVVVG